MLDSYWHAIIQIFPGKLTDFQSIFRVYFIHSSLEWFYSILSLLNTLPCYQMLVILQLKSISSTQLWAEHAAERFITRKWSIIY